MAGSVSDGNVLELFKKVYGSITDIQPNDFKFARLFPFEASKRVGEEFRQALILTAETGITLGGSDMDAFDILPPVAGSVKQTSIKPYATVLASVIPWGVLSRAAADNDPRSFMDATKFIVKNNLKSHNKFLEILRIHGQSSKMLGRVSYATATYRGVSLTAGAGTINGVAFATGGVNTSAKAILLAPGDFAAGIWVGMEGMNVCEVDANNAIVAEGKLIGVDAEYGFIYVDFVPVAASSTTSHRLCIKGMEESKEAIGMRQILTTTSGNLFGIPVANYSLFKPVSVNCNSEKFSFVKFSVGVGQAINRGGLGDGAEGDGDLEIFVNPRTWATLINTEAGRRQYDDSYKSTEAENGQEAIVFHTEAGRAAIMSHRMMMEGDAAAVSKGTWIRSGSTEISFKVPGSTKDLIFPLENQAGMAFRSFSDQYMLCMQPSKNIWFYGINDESNT